MLTVNLVTPIYEKKYKNVVIRTLQSTCTYFNSCTFIIINHDSVIFLINTIRSEPIRTFTNVYTFRFLVEKLLMLLGVLFISLCNINKNIIIHLPFDSVICYIFYSPWAHSRTFMLKSIVTMLTVVLAGFSTKILNITTTRLRKLLSIK